ncbi:MAG: rod-binding protein [Selenomonadaceae bacterium]|nr:rod-binding protein [Selenomonadaceae bacterium]
MQIDTNNMDTNSILARQQAQAWQGSREADKAKSFADELQAAQKNTLDDPAYQKKLKDACKGFESMFIQMMWKEMRKTVPENSLFGESDGEKIFQDMLDTEMSDRMSEAGGLGLADVMYKQLTAQYQAHKDMEARAKASLAARGRQVDLPG